MQGLHFQLWIWRKESSLQFYLSPFLCYLPILIKRTLYLWFQVIQLLNLIKKTLYPWFQAIQLPYLIKEILYPWFQVIQLLSLRKKTLCLWFQATQLPCLKKETLYLWFQTIQFASFDQLSFVGQCLIQCDLTSLLDYPRGNSSANPFLKKTK